jgi:hypothetical protein
MQSPHIALIADCLIFGIDAKLNILPLLSYYYYAKGTKSALATEYGCFYMSGK